ncbi:transposase family protein [Streptomyces sp. NPDC001493]
MRDPAFGATETLIGAVRQAELDREVNAGVLGFHPVRQQETRLPKPLITNRGRVRVPSSLIRVLQRHCADTDSTCPETGPSQLACLADVLGRIPDPRRVRGRRYHLGSLLALCLVGVLAGATSLAAFAADTDSDLCDQLGPTSSAPNGIAAAADHYRSRPQHAAAMLRLTA